MKGGRTKNVFPNSFLTVQLYPDIILPPIVHLVAYAIGETLYLIHDMSRSHNAPLL